MEYQSAEMIKIEGHHPSNRVTRLRSAAALAYKAGNFPEAQRIIAIARSEQPDGYESIKLDDIEAAIQRESNGQVQVTGALTAADADASQISIRELETSKVYAFTVPEKMFRRVVKKHWLDVVRAIGNASPQGMLTLEKISPA